MRIDYRLAETYLTVRGRVVTVIDPYANAGDLQAEPDGVTVEIGIRGDEGNGHRSLEVGGRGDADEEFSIGLTADKRISGITYKSTGTGARVVKSATTFLAFVGGLAARVGLGAAGATEVTAVPARDGDGAAQAPPTQPLTPEEKAAAAWAVKYATLAGLRAAYRASLDALATNLLEARTDAAAAPSAADQIAALARAHRLERLLDDARQEVATIDDLYRTWRASTLTRRESEVVRVLAVEELPERERGELPQPGQFEEHLTQVWETLGVTVQIEPADGYVRLPREHAPNHQPPWGDDATEARRVRWRLPRPARLTVWRRDPATGLPVLERSVPVHLLDERCATEGIELTSRLFGSRAAELTFDENGVPLALTRKDESGVAAFAEALGEVPGAVSGALEAASKAQASVGTLVDAAAQRRTAAAKREYEHAQDVLNLKGLAATAEDFARAKRLEQRVAIATAEGSLAPPSEVAALEAELREVTTRTNLAAARRQEALEHELGELRAETARLQALLAEAAARGDLRSRDGK